MTFAHPYLWWFLVTGAVAAALVSPLVMGLKPSGRRVLASVLVVWLAFGLFADLLYFATVGL